MGNRAVGNSVCESIGIEICNAVRERRFGYQLRCLEPRCHVGSHLWTPELVEAPLQAS